MTGAPALAPAVRHALCAAWRFTDAFSGRAVVAPLDVSVGAIPFYAAMPALPWTAASTGDGVYRFLVSGGAVAPVGTFAVSVTVPSLDYAAFEPLAMTLPRALAGLLPQRSDFLIEAPLWPTRLFAVPPGETAVVGTIADAAGAPVAGLRVTLWSAVHAVAPAGTPYTYTDANGDFVFRLLGRDFRVNVAGGVTTTTAGVSVSLLAPPAFTTAVTPTTPFPQTVHLGQVNPMSIRVP